jgi:hypothetical protein
MQKENWCKHILRTTKSGLLHNKPEDREVSDSPQLDGRTYSLEVVNRPRRNKYEMLFAQNMHTVRNICGCAL